MKRYLISIICIVICLGANAQSPQSFQYQAVVRDASGNAVVNQLVNFRFTIISGALPGTVVYQETQFYTTNNYGIATVAIGSGTPIISTFSSIDWNVSLIYLKVEADMGSGYLNMGTTQLLSVPYAMYAQTAGGTVDTLWLQNGNNIFNNNSGNVGVGINNPTGRMVIQGSASAAVTDPLFEVKNSLGQTVFVVYPDSVHVFVKDDGAKSNQGGFAVSGRSNSKPVTNDYLNVTPDQTRIYTTDPIYGFGVGDVATGTAVNYMHLTPENYLIGHEAGIGLIGGSAYNSMLGYQAGKILSIGDRNVFMGFRSGSNLQAGSDNVFIGDSAGCNGLNSMNNVYIGTSAGMLGTGYYNVMIGTDAGRANSSGKGNVFVGDKAGKNISNDDNTFIGREAGSNNMNGFRNTFIGSLAGDSAVGYQNVFIGYNSGKLANGNGNVFVGNYSGKNAIGNFKLIMSSSISNIPLIFGDFANPEVVINGNSTDNTTSLNFFVNGTSGGLYAWSNVSDKKFKKNIEDIANPLDKVKKLKGVNFEWNDSKKFEPGIQMGFIAQDVEKIIPEVVRVKDGNYAMQYAPLTALLVEAIKEQQKQIEKLNSENIELKEQVEKLNKFQSEFENLKTEIEKIKKYQVDNK